VNVDSLLQTHAEVAVALAGFASVAAVLQRPLSPRGRQRFLSILFAALIQVLGGLVPVWLSNIGVSGPMLWRTATALVLFLSITLIVWVILRLRALGGTSVVLINLPITLISNALAALTFVVLLLNLVGVPGPPGFGLYYTAQLMGLTVVFVLFADVVVGADGESS
jgi:hypothetical protein